MSTAMPAKAKGVRCPYCCGTQFRSRGRYSPLSNVRFIYSECARCEAHLKLKVQLVWARRATSPPRAG